MGAQLVGKAFAWSVDHDLKPNAKLVLLFMAHTALDGDQRPKYFAARESTALALGRRVPDQPLLGDPHYLEITRTREAAFRRVVEATKELVDKGAIRRIKAGRQGARAQFELCFEELEMDSAPTENVALSTTESVGQGDGIRRDRATKNVPHRNQEEPQEPSRGEISPHSTTSRSGVDNSDVSAA